MTTLAGIENGQIWTGNPLHPWAESMTISSGRITAVDESGSASTLNVHGCFVCPGLIDAHLHLLEGGEAMDQLDLSQIRSRAEFESAIAHRHAELSPDRWLIAGGWSNENWPSRVEPNKSWLAAAGDRPVVCRRMDMHVVLVNQPVLDRCDLSVDLSGSGRIVRDPDSGAPTGLMVEAAAWQLVNPLIPKPTIEEQKAALLNAQQHCHSFGLTVVRSMEYINQVCEVFQPLRDQLTLRCQITLLDRAWPMKFDFGHDFENDDRLEVIGYKTFADGTLGSRTARMLEYYCDDPGNRGMLVEIAADGHLRDWAHAVANNSLSPAIHAIGDEAVRIALDAIEGIDSTLRPTIEHAQQIHQDDLSRFTNVIASMQPLHKADDCRYVRDRLGPDRLAGTFAFRSLLDAGAILAFGSDWPVVSCDPMLGIRAAVTGLTLENEPFGVEQNLTVEEALIAYTRNAAHTIHLDHTGVIQPGAFADLVMLDRDPFTANWIADPPKIVLTMMGGEIVYDAR